MHPVVAVTLGSNGFHLIELSEVDGKMETTQHLYENVQAESFLDQDMCLDEKGAEGRTSPDCRRPAHRRTENAANQDRLY